MKLDSKNIEIFNTAINEASFYDLKFDKNNNQVKIFLQMAVIGPNKKYDPEFLTRVELHGVQEIKYVLNRDRNQDHPDNMPLPLDQIEDLIRGTGGTALYGWQFINPEAVPDAFTETIQWDLGKKEPMSVLNIFQDGADATASHFIDLYFTFQSVTLVDHEGKGLTEDEIIAGGDLAWTEFYKGSSEMTQLGRRPIADKNGRVNHAEGSETRIQAKS